MNVLAPTMREIVDELRERYSLASSYTEPANGVLFNAHPTKACSPSELVHRIERIYARAST